MTPGTTPIAIASRLRRIRLPRPGGGPDLVVPWTGRGTTVLVVPPAATSDGFRTFLRRLGEQSGGLRGWDGRVVLVTGTTREVDAPSGVEIATDPERALARQLTDVARGAVVVLDRFGQVYLARHLDVPPLPDPATTILDEVRYIAIQCPECDTPDTPSATVMPDGWDGRAVIPPLVP